MPINFTEQDVVGSLLAVILFAAIFLAPGYLIGWWLDIFKFRERLPFVKFIFGIVLSNAFSPVIFFLAYRFGSAKFAITLCLITTAAWIITMISQKREKAFPLSEDTKRYQSIALILLAGWIVFSISLLVDIQIGQKLYFSTASYDLTTRVSVVDAITRTGVPPINPSYYPGHPEQLTFLYYFWYVLASLVDQLGGAYVSAYQAMIASITWCGISLVATIAVYLRLRTKDGQGKFWQRSVRAAQLFAVSGLDFIVLAIFIVEFKTRFGYLPFEGRIEGWNMPVMSWMNAINWVPHHIAGALACMTGLMIFIETDRDASLTKKILSAILIGLAFASAFGLSVWVPFTFAVFLVAWMVFMLFQKQDRQKIWILLLAGIFALIFCLPFLTGIFHPGNSSSNGGLPIALYVRPFTLSVYLSSSPQVVQNIANLFFLPISYIFEFGFYFAIALLWLQSYLKQKKHNNPYHKAEILLIITTTILLSFVYSRLIAINDLGIRGWLPMQFILVAWASDLIEKYAPDKLLLIPSLFKSFPGSKRQTALLSFMFVVGILTTTLEVVDVRAWPMLVDLKVVGFPNELSPDTNLGSRTYDARLAYNFIRDHIPPTAITQSNPTVYLDRPSGLYGTHQMVISDRTPYGLSSDGFLKIVGKISPAFTNKNSDWNTINTICNQNFIDVVIIKDTDPIWSNVATIEQKQMPLYSNPRYAVFACGAYANHKP